MAAAANMDARLDEFDGAEADRERFYACRDYSKGIVAFKTTLPAKLEGRVDAAKFAEVIEHINSLIEQAETYTFPMFLMNLCNCLAGWTLDLCLSNPYAAYFKQITAYTAVANKEVFQPNKLRMIDPLHRGLRVIEFVEADVDSALLMI